MKRSFTILAILAMCASLKVSAQSIGISDVTHTPDASAALDIYSTTRGLLIPRIALTSTTSASPVSSPIASMMVYNTATTGDVTPGYYFWDGSSKWLRLMSNTDAKPLNIVTKTAAATLLKTENMVLASGDITLTLPTVTSADDGLEISIKNVGTYSDLITVVPQSGKMIDATANSKLSRWRGRTFVATGSNWVIKEKETRADNLLDVSATGSFTTIEEVIAFLNEDSHHHMTGPTVVRLGGGVYEVDATQVIDLPYSVTFEGLSFGETEIKGTAGLSGDPMLECETECYFKMLIFTAYASTSGNDAIHFNGSEKNHEVKDCYFNGFNTGIISTSNNELWIFETDFDEHTGVGIEIASGSNEGGFIKVSECDFTKCAKGINLLSGEDQDVSIMNCTFYNTTSGSDIGINYVAATFAPFKSIFITNNAWNNKGTYITGFDFSRSDGRDANAHLVNNAGMEDEKPHCKINVANNSSNTTITTAGTYYKASWTNSSAYTCKWTVSGNRMTYQPNNGGDVWAVITGDIIPNAAHIFTFAIVKNGVTSTLYGETALRNTSANQPTQFSTVIYVPDVKKNDYLELFVTSNYNGDVINFNDIQWFANTQ
jgi:hypothetical protein